MAGYRAIDGEAARDLRWAGGLMLAGAGALSILPAGAGLPCPLRTITGIPCPLCGMTTSVAAGVHLDVTGALVANPVGLALIAVAVALLVLRPRRIPMPSGRCVVVVMALMWAYQLHRFGLFL